VVEQLIDFVTEDHHWAGGRLSPDQGEPRPAPGGL